MGDAQTMAAVKSVRHSHLQSVKTLYKATVPHKRTKLTNAPKQMQMLMESCPGKTAVSGVMGFALGGAFGLFMASVCLFPSPPFLSLPHPYMNPQLTSLDAIRHAALHQPARRHNQDPPPARATQSRPPRSRNPLLLQRAQFRQSGRHFRWHRMLHRGLPCEE